MKHGTHEVGVDGLIEVGDSVTNGNYTFQICIEERFTLSDPEEQTRNKDESRQ